MHQNRPKQPDNTKRTAIEQIIANRAVRPVYQPIVHLREGIIVGRESLTRTALDSGIDSPAELFDLADEFGLQWPLEQITTAASLKNAAGWTAGTRLFLNHSPDVFTDPRFATTLLEQIEQTPGLTPDMIVLEITERVEECFTSELRTQVETLKLAGFQIAIDDVGAGASGLNRIMHLRPHWLKLDREIVRHIDADSYKQNLMDFFVHFARVSGVNLIAEGIERTEELQTLMELGVEFGQGFLLARPGDREQVVSDEAIECIRTHATATARSRSQRLGEATIDSVMRPALVFESDQSIIAAAEQLLLQQDVPGVAVVSNRRYIGWLPRAAVLAAGSTNEGGGTLGEHTSLAMPALLPKTPILDAAQTAAAREEPHFFSPLVVVDASGVLGIVTIQDLLRISVKSTTAHDARAEPLTGLPSRAKCDHRLTALLHNHERADIAFLDIRNLHVYNDTLGYDVGDLLLRVLAGAVLSIAEAHKGAYSDFVGHIGDDRFVLIRRNGDIYEALHAIVDEFESSAARLIGCANEHDETLPQQIRPTPNATPTHNLPPASLRLVVLQDAAQRAETAHELHALAARLLQNNAPQKHGDSLLFVDRRAPKVALDTSLDAPERRIA